MPINLLKPRVIISFSEYEMQKYLVVDVAMQKEIEQHKKEYKAKLFLEKSSLKKVKTNIFLFHKQ